MADEAIIPPTTDIISIAYQRLADWIALQGGNVIAMIAAVAPTPGGFIASILAFLAKIMPLLGCVLPVAGQSKEEAQKAFVTDHPVLAEMRLNLLAHTHGSFQRHDIPLVTGACMHLLTVSTAPEYKAFAAAA